MKIYIGADHRGYELKEKICRWLFELEHAYMDVGASHLDLNDDYTKYAAEVASLVAGNPNSRGILICGSGVGIEVAANKFDGIRAAIGKDVFQVEAGRNDDDMNILVLASDYTDEKEAKGMVIAFLETKFSGKEKYKKRLQEIENIEANN